MTIGSLWVLAVMAFWGVLFCLMFYFVWLIARGRDSEEDACDLPDPIQQSETASHAHLM